MTVANIDKCLKIDNNALLKYVIGRIVRHISTANDKSAFCVFCRSRLLRSENFSKKLCDPPPNPMQILYK